MALEALGINQISLARPQRKDCDFMTRRGQLIYQVVRTGSNSIWNIRNNIGDSHAQILGKLSINMAQILPYYLQTINAFQQNYWDDLSSWETIMDAFSDKSGRPCVPHHHM